MNSVGVELDWKSTKITVHDIVKSISYVRANAGLCIVECYANASLNVFVFIFICMIGYCAKTKLMRYRFIKCACVSVCDQIAKFLYYQVFYEMNMRTFFSPS